jgi:tetratricopeptide (TPR) repeat protein
MVVFLNLLSLTESCHHHPSNKIPFWIRHGLGCVRSVYHQPPGVRPETVKNSKFRDPGDPQGRTVSRFVLLDVFLLFLLAWLLSVHPAFASFQLPTLTPEIEEQLKIAQDAEKNKDYERSAGAYRKILKIQPQWALIHQSLGVVRHLQNKYPEAILSFETALKLDPKLWGSYLFLGMDYYRTNQFPRAIPALQQALQLNPEMAELEVRFWLGSSFLALEQFDKAIEQFRRLVELKPRDLEAFYVLAQTYSRYSTALYKEIGDINKESAEAHRLQAEWYVSQDKLDQAIDEYQQVAGLRPQWEGVHLELGNLFLKQEKLTKASQELEKELKLSPNDTTVQLQLSAIKSKFSQNPSQGIETEAPLDGSPDDSFLSTSSAPNGPTSSSSEGILKFRERNFKEAKELFLRALRQDPGDSIAQLYLGRTLFGLGDYQEAIEALQKLRTESGENLETLYWLGKAYQETAAATLQRMIDIDSGSYRVYQMSGELLEEKMRYAEALKSYQRALKQSPDLSGIRFAIGNVYWKLQQLDDAITWLKEELARNPYHSMANYRLGNIYLSKASPELAIPFLERATQATPSLLAAQQELGKAYLSLGRNQEAIERFKVVAVADPQDDAIHYILAGAYKKAGQIAEANAELKIFGQLRQKKAERDRLYLERKISKRQEK